MEIRVSHYQLFFNNMFHLCIHSITPWNFARWFGNSKEREMLRVVSLDGIQGKYLHNNLREN